MRKFLLTIVAMVLWVALVGAGALITYNEIWVVQDEDGNTTWDKLMDDVEGLAEAPIYYFGESEESSPEENPGEEVPGGEEVPEGDQTGDGTITE